MPLCGSRVGKNILMIHSHIGLTSEFRWKSCCFFFLEFNQMSSDASRRMNKTNLLLNILSGEISSRMKGEREIYRDNAEEEEERGALQLTVLNLVSSPLSVNRWKWAITLFDVARQNFYHPTLLPLLLDLSADFKAPPPPSSISLFSL